MKEPRTEDIIVRILPELDKKIEECYKELSEIEDRVSLELTGRKLMGVIRHRQIDEILTRAYREPDYILANLESKILTHLRASLIYTLAERLIKNEKFRRFAPQELIEETEKLVKQKRTGTLLAYSEPILAMAGRFYGLSSPVVPDRERRWGRQRKNGESAGESPAPGNR